MIQRIRYPAVRFWHGKELQTLLHLLSEINRVSFFLNDCQYKRKALFTKHTHLVKKLIGTSDIKKDFEIQKKKLLKTSRYWNET